MAKSNLQTKIQEISDTISTVYKCSEAILNHTIFSRLPDDYTELEYISTNGTQYLNTGYTHKANTKIECKINVTQDSVHNYQFIFGARQNDYQYYAMTFATRWNGSNTFCYCRTGNEKTGGTTYYGQDITIEAYQSKCTWTNSNGQSSSITTSGTINAGVNPMGIFCVNTTSSGSFSAESGTYAGNTKLYYFNIYEVDTLVRQYVPAKRTTDNVLGLFDLVNKTFITNLGSGSFGAGPEV